MITFFHPPVPSVYLNFEWRKTNSKSSRWQPLSGVDDRRQVHAMMSGVSVCCVPNVVVKLHIDAVIGCIPTFNGTFSRRNLFLSTGPGGKVSFSYHLIYFLWHVCNLSYQYLQYYAVFSCQIHILCALTVQLNTLTGVNCIKTVRAASLAIDDGRVPVYVTYEII